MAAEYFTVVALPHSRAPGADFHVSLFISPRLTPDGAEGELRDFTHFPHWAALLKSDAKFELRDQNGLIEATPLLDPIEPAVWDAVFPDTTPVRGPEPPKWETRHWRTFRAAEVHDFAKLLHVVAMVLDPTSPLAPSAHPLTAAINILGGGSEGRRDYDESRITSRYDEMLGEAGHGTEHMSLAAIEKNIASTEEPLGRLFMEIHRARRFYERPEAQAKYSERPDPNATLARPPRPGPDFHERCSLAGDHPVLQRTLGLVVDLEVDDLPRLATSQWLSARIIPSGDEDAYRPTRTSCRAVGDTLVTESATEDWRNGRLRIADSGRFGVLDMDPDGTALKLDRYLFTLPRLLAAEKNGDPVHAAPTALRSIGFTVVRHQKALQTQDRIGRQNNLRQQVEVFDQPLLMTEDVTQGMRVEVFDDTTDTWYTLHARTIDVEALDHGTVMDDAHEEGFIQGTTATETPDVDDSPVHVHEAMFGWDGWSLSAPRPGKRVRHEDGDEIVEDQDADPDPVTPLLIRPTVAGGTLPRLRYGRSYAFRVWATDLAGNSRPHEIGPVPPPPSQAVNAVGAAITGIVPLVSHAAFAEAELRSQTAASVMRRRLTAVPFEEAVLPAVLHQFGVETEVLSRLRTLRGDRLGPARIATSDRASIVSRAFADVVIDEGQPFIVATTHFDAAVIVGGVGGIGGAGGAGGVDITLDEVATVSPLVPFLRWDPVPPPAIVSLHGFSAGESLRQLVVRSGVTQDLDTLEITVTPPTVYGPDHADLGYRATSERHLAPPKTSQSEAELHEAFDTAIGSTDPADHKTLLAVALREAGTLFDVDVPRLDDPSIRDPQPGIALHAGPEVPVAELKTLPLTKGEAPFPGQYVVHDTPQLKLPYLPDVVASGISLVFPEAGRDRQIAFPFGTEGFTARYLDDWPEPLPFRLILEGSARLDGRLDGTELHIGLPPGDVQRFRLASSLDAADLHRFGLWRILPPVLTTNTDIIEAAADGWLWCFTPFDEMTLVHAVPRPLDAPRMTVLNPVRVEGSVDFGLVGAIDIHGPSTESLTAECRWTDPVDDLDLDRWEDRAQTGVAFTTVIRPEEDLAVLVGGFPDAPVTIPGFGPLWVHRAVHLIGDTKHHTMRYRFRATTRFREYFDAVTLAPAPPPTGPIDPARPVDDGKSVVGPEIVVNVPSSARPAAPIVHSALPLFRWDEGTEPEQPVAVRRRRRAGVRLYLQRPWYSSGEGELVGVLLAPGGNDAELPGLVSQWGQDPVWVSAPVGQRAVLGLDNLVHMLGFDDRPSDAGPVRPPATHPLTAVAGAPDVTVLGYVPQYSQDRELWYVDIAIDPGSTFWPFVRLAIARYQPDSISGCHLSKPTLCDFVQLTPERTTSVSRTDIRHVRVVVSGPVGVRFPPGGQQTPPPTTPAALGAWLSVNRKVVARLQQRDPLFPTDLGWKTVAATELTVRGHGRNVFEAAWVGSLESPDEDLPLHRPGENEDWRVTVEEWERLPGDPADLGAGGLFSPPPVWEQRLIYADELQL